MSCPYSEKELQEFDSICNPMGNACYYCADCECEHWSNFCPIDCDGFRCDGERKFQEYYHSEEKNVKEVKKEEKKYVERQIKSA